MVPAAQSSRRTAWLRRQETVARIPETRSQPEAQMAMNALLLWMSARQSGSTGSFRSKVTELGLTRGRSAHRVVQWNLEKLGHAEFGQASAGTGWRVAPPILAAGDPMRSPSAVLCGARTPALLDRLSSGDVQKRRQIQSEGPDIVEIEAPSARALEGCAARAGIEVQWNAPLAILACYPPPTKQQLVPTELPIGGLGSLALLEDWPGLGSKLYGSGASRRRWPIPVPLKLRNSARTYRERAAIFRRTGNGQIPHSQEAPLSLALCNVVWRAPDARILPSTAIGGPGAHTLFGRPPGVQRRSAHLQQNRTSYGFLGSFAARSTAQMRGLHDESD